MKKIINTTLVLVVVAAFQGCYYDKADIVYPTTTCDTTSIKYSPDIQSIMSANCDRCHAGTATGSFGINLDSYASLKSEANSGQLLQRITATDPSVMMPKGGPRLSDCDINKFRAWISNGTPN